MAEPTRCEEPVPNKVTDEHGKKLPDEWGRCEHNAAFSVQRPFSGLSSVVCGTHIRTYHRRQALGQVTIAELKGES